MTRGLLNATTLHKLVPDAASREIMLCGPPPMMDAVTAVLRGLGTPSHHIHTERFAY
jgi:ferredoxin-NADP reductase